MTTNNRNLTPSGLTAAIIGGMQEKKALKITTINLSKIKNAICEYFVICHGNSRTQVEAIADGVKDYVIKNAEVRPWRSEGYENAEWILIDYVDVVVHIFREEARTFYNLEKLWGDAPVEEFSDNVIITE
jgi:ribosome-associated protein